MIERIIGIAFLVPLLLIATMSSAQQLNLIAPSTFIPSTPLPMVVEATTGSDLDRFYTQNLSFNVSGGQLSDPLKVKKGRGMINVLAGTGNSMEISGNGISRTVSSNLNSALFHDGLLTGDQTWNSGSVHHITGDLHIPSGASLLVESGCWILLDSAVNIAVDGSLVIQGTASDPVTLVPSSQNNGWGGISANGGTVNLSYCLITGAGGDASLAYGHSNSQAVAKSNFGEMTLNRCFIFDCFGKGIGAENGTIFFMNGAIARCDMGGEFVASYSQIRSSHITDIPNDDGIFQDDDNDGLYFSGAPSGNTNPSIVDSCVVLTGKDDGIDHNNGIIEVKNSWIEDFENEGVAASNGNSVLVYNTLLKDCEQGIEAGYGSPTVTVDHCVMINCDYGLRFGDWYTSGCTGSIVCTNSITTNNTDNIYNFDMLTNGPVANAIDISYSITNDVEYDSETGCVTGAPDFTSEYLLQAGSVGISGANDGSNMGLVGSISTAIDELEMTTGKLISVDIYNLNGALVKSVDPTDLLPLKSGIYIRVELYERSIRSKKLVVIK